MPAAPTVALVVDPRFPGGTSSAVASEIRAMMPLVRPEVHAVSSRMFQGQEPAPQLAAAFADCGIEPLWDRPVIGADTVILHNPSFLRFQSDFGRRIVARRLIVVTHENFLRPGGAEAFDVAACLGQIDRAALALSRAVVPVSPLNRATVIEWQGRAGLPPGWEIMAGDWFNICDFPMTAPTERPRDRRGRHSRGGFEKFPARAELDLCFPRAAEANVILGADILMAGDTPRHWQLYPFRGIEVARYFEMIDFMVYFTAPTWQESFGRVIAEAIAAGKVVITDAATAATFGPGVIAARPSRVDAIIAGLVADPARYRAQVLMAQAALARFRPEAFRARLAALSAPAQEAAA